MEIKKVEVKWENGAYEYITNELPDKMMYEVARTTLDLVYPTIPELTGRTKQSSLARGVQGSNCNYKIGSYTDYAIYPYKMNNETTHWTTPGTNSYWFDDYWAKNGKSIVENVVERNKLK